MEREKNALFLGATLLIIIVLVGANLVDSSLTKLILPSEPFATIGLDYQHGIVVRGSGREIALKAANLGKIEVAQDNFLINTRFFLIKIPFVLTWGNINSLRHALQLTK